MIYLLIVYCIVILIIGLGCSKNNLFSPSVMTSSIWLGCLLLFVCLKHPLPELKSTFILSNFIWISGLCISSLVVQSATFPNQNLNEPNKLIQNILLILSIIYFPSLLEFAQRAVLTGGTGSWAMNLRLAALGKLSGFKEPYGGIEVIIWQVSFLLELLQFKKKTWWRLALISFIYLSFGFFTMAKVIFMNFFLFSCCVLYFKKVIKMKHILIGLSILLVFFFGLQSVRQAVKFSDVHEDFFVTYILSNMSAFDTLQPASAEHWGENTFRFIYAVAYKMGISNIEPVETILKWIYKPVLTNTYSGMYPFFVDFGYWGVLIFSLILGSLYGWAFRKAQMGNNFHILLYAIFLNVIFMQYAAELLFTNLAGYFKLFIGLSIPFLFTKKNLDIAINKVQKIRKQHR